DDGAQRAACEMSFARDLRGHDIARCCARDEHNQSVAPRYTISAGGDRVYGDADGRHQLRSPSIRAACFQESTASGRTVPAPAALDVAADDRADLSRSASSAPAIAATLNAFSPGDRARIWGS